MIETYEDKLDKMPSLHSYPCKHCVHFKSHHMFMLSCQWDDLESQVRPLFWNEQYGGNLIYGPSKATHGPLNREHPHFNEYVCDAFSGLLLRGS